MGAGCPKVSDSQCGQEGFLGYLHVADLLHAALALFLLLEELAFAGYVTTVAFGGNVFAVSAYGLAGDHTLAHGGLHRHLELLAGDQLFELLDERASTLVGLAAVDDDGERIDGVTGDEDLDLYQVGRLVAERLVVVGGVALCAALHGVEEVRDDLGQRQVVGELHPAGGDVLHPDGDPAPFVAEPHHGTHVLLGADHGSAHYGLPDLIEDLR